MLFLSALSLRERAASGEASLPVASRVREPQALDRWIPFLMSKPLNSDPSSSLASERLMILCTTTGYQTRAFMDAAHEMGLEAVLGSDRCHILDDPWQDQALALRFEDPEGAARQIVESARREPLRGIVAIGDCTPPAAARAAHWLNLPYHAPTAADICRDKYRSRERLRAAGLNIPAFERFPLDRNPREIFESGGPSTGFPCVLKPLALSASRGVIRANNPQEFIQSFERIRSLLRAPEVQVMRQGTSKHLQVESYIDGREIAVEGVLERGAAKILAIFDKPDPLTGPYFEETIYVTPAQLTEDIERRLRYDLARALRTLGLFHGPFHAELRLNEQGVWPLEIAARSIGGLCSRSLRFSSPCLGEKISLEKLIVALAVGESVKEAQREPAASGVMMIPIEQEGIYEGVEGVEQARETPGIEDVLITAKPAQRVVPLPEGASYLGFIFARGSTPQFVEQALREAHGRLRVRVSPVLPVIT
ncbi:MAG TPA: ATP-grasp domain-containing protein [Terriglobia bacterium]|nr:ATP-grasp domain-containing protein [Terriglobia bacterium]